MYKCTHIYIYIYTYKHRMIFISDKYMKNRLFFEKNLGNDSSRPKIVFEMWFLLGKIHQNQCQMGHIHTHTQTHTHTHTNTHTHTHSHTPGMDIYIDTHLHTHIHTWHGHIHAELMSNVHLAWFV